MTAPILGDPSRSAADPYDLHSDLIREEPDFYAQFHLDLVRCIKQLDAIVENVGNKLGDSDVELVLEIRAKNQQGFNDATQRTVSENARNLEAESSEFE